VLRRVAPPFFFLRDHDRSNCKKSINRGKSYKLGAKKYDRPDPFFLTSRTKGSKIRKGDVNTKDNNQNDPTTIQTAVRCRNQRKSLGMLNIVYCFVWNNATTRIEKKKPPVTCKHPKNPRFVKKQFSKGAELAF
jgi:hypothetical protein